MTKVERLNKITSALEDIHSESPIDAEVAYQVLEELNISPSVNPKEIEKQVVEVSIERKALKENLTVSSKTSHSMKNWNVTLKQDDNHQPLTMIQRRDGTLARKKI